MEGEELCGLCVKAISASNSVSLNDERRDMLLYTIPEVILDSSPSLKICQECSDCLQTAYEFKTFCLERKLYIKQDETVEAVAMVQNSEFEKCCLCWSCIEANAGIEEEVLIEQASLKLMLKECIPDLNIRMKDNSTQCAKCMASVKNMFCFIKRCMESGEKMKSIASRALTKKEENACDVSNSAQFSFVKIENTDTIKDEGPDTKDQVELIAFIKKEPEALENDFDEFAEDCVFPFKTEAIEEGESEQEITDHEYDEMKLEQNETTTTEQTPPFKCTQCRYKTNILHRFQAHSVKHKDPLSVKKFKCTVCLYEAKYNYHVQDHMLTHLDPSETTMFKCYNCPFETKRKSALKMHLLTHKDPSELKMFKCQSCSFETKWRDCLKKHQARHKSLNEGITYRCEFCNYVTNKKHLLRPHLLRHKNPSDITMYKCDWCPYEAKQKSNLQKHLVKHKEPSEITMYKCDICSYATKWQSGIKAHRMKHEKRHKCDKCPFEADEKNDLFQHLLSHPEDASLRIYSCEECTYSTRYKTNLNKHMNTHKDSSEVPTFSCNQCSYVTKHKTALKNHAFVHMDTSELTLFKCELCTYETFRKSYLLKHVDRHKVAKKEAAELE